MLATHLGFYNVASSRTHVRFQFSTHAAAGGNVAPNSAFEAADLRIYKAADGAAFSATQRTSANGITMTSPFDSLTGFHDVDIDLADNTDAGFYAAGSMYAVVLAPDETVDGQTLTGVVLAYFEIGRPQSDVREFGGSAGTFAGGRPEVNLTHWKGTAPDDLIAGHVQADMQAVLDGVLTAAKFADAFLTAAKIAADAFTAAKFHADVTTEFQSGLATAAALAVTDGKIDVIDNFLDTEIAAILAAVDTEIAQILTDLAAVGVIVDAIKTKTDALPSDPADASVVAGLIAALEAKIDIVDSIIDSITSRIPAALAAGGQIKARAEVVDDKSDYALSAAGQAAVADKLLGRTRAGGADGGRTVAQCLAFGRNKWAIAGGTLTVYADDDSTPLYTATIATAPGDPITESTPV